MWRTLRECLVSRRSFGVLAAGQKDASIPHSSLLFEGDWLDLCKQPHLLSLLGHAARPCLGRCESVHQIRPKTAGASQPTGPDSITGLRSRISLSSGTSLLPQHVRE